MEKKKALGGDPLSWLKEKKREGQEEVNNTDQEQQLQKPTTPQAKGEEVERLGYEANSAQTLKSQDTAQKRKTIVIGDHEPVYGTKIHTTPKPKENPATIFVVVYTVLLLILGFLVFRDLTKKINTLESKITHLEKQLDSGYTKYEDTDF